MSSRERVQQFLLAVAGHSGNTDHLTGTHFKLHVHQVYAKLVLLLERQTVDLEHGVTRLHIAVLQCRWLGTNHQARQRGVRLFTGLQ